MEISTILRRLKEYQAAMGYVPEKMSINERMEVIRQYVLALNVEQIEMLDELPWKPWKNYSVMEYDTFRVTEEWVDCLVFLVDQAIILGISAKEIEQTLVKVMDKNFQRIQNDYSKKRTTHNDYT